MMNDSTFLFKKMRNAVSSFAPQRSAPLFISYLTIFVCLAVFPQRSLGIGQTYSYSDDQAAALAACLQTRASTFNAYGGAANGHPGTPTILYASECPLESGYYVGYYNWYVLKFTFLQENGSITTAEYDFMFEGSRRKGMGNGGGCDGGQGGNGPCAIAQGAPMVGDPINIASGNKYIEEEDYSINPWLVFRRFYNSDRDAASGNLGPQWRHTYERQLSLTSIPGQPAAMLVLRPDGKQQTFIKSGSLWSADMDVADRLTELKDAQGAITGYQLFVSALKRYETYDALGVLRSVNDESGNGIALSYSNLQTDPSIAPHPGLLLSVVDFQGRSLAFSYGNSGRLRSIALPDGNIFSYSYDSSSGDLTGVQYPGGAIREYKYDESGMVVSSSPSHKLTGIVDENGHRFENTIYDAAGRAVLTGRPNGIDQVQITYDSSTTSTVQYASGIQTTFTIATAQRLKKVSALSQPCSPACDQTWKTRTYDGNGYPASYTDFNGNKTTTTYTNGLLTQKVEAVGASIQRTTQFTWDTNLRVPLTRSVLNTQNSTLEKSAWVYNTLGQILARCEINYATAFSYVCAVTGAPPSGVQRWTYTYNALGQVLTADGPRTDVSDITTNTYYASASSTVGSVHSIGDLATISNALGQVTSITNYDLNGRPLSIADANGVVTTLTYWPRGWLKSRTVAGTQTTTYDYDGVGQLTKVTLSDLSYLSYTYDTAHRLTDITDNVGNKTHYTLDAMGNRIQEDTKDPSGNILKTRSRIFDALNRLQKDIGGTSPSTQITQYDYDNNGNLKNITDPLNHITTNGYDALNRLITVTDPANGVATTTYNALDQVTQVKDPRLVTTDYTINALGDVTLTASPDNGNTNKAYDLAGNVIQKTDARGVVSNYTYDALNRVTSITYPANTAENVTFSYDSTTNGNKGIGKLTFYGNDGGSTVLVYDAFGNITTQTEMVGSQINLTSYQYDNANRLIQITYPSGRIVSYTRNALGQITQVQTKDTATASAVSIISNATYEPFGPLKTLAYGNAVTTTLLHDADYRTSRITTTTLPAWDFVYSYDAAGNLTQQSDQVGAFSKTFGYDNLDRVTSDVNNTGAWTYQYDANGNRTKRISSSTQTVTFAATSNRITQNGSTVQTLDAAGNLTGAGTKTYTYNNANRLSLVSNNGTVVSQATYNALNQRTQKLQIAKPFQYHYGQHDEILGITVRYPSGTLYQRVEYLWLDGSTPLAQVRTTYNSNGSVSSRRTTYIHADHLNTPRTMSDSTKAIVWRWDGDAYGQTAPNENPDGNGTTDTLSLRFPGQIIDTESGLYYNLNRDYDPATGRYVQSDPIGLDGGLNTYGYVEGNPVSFTDPLGLQTTNPTHITNPNQYPNFGGSSRLFPPGSIGAAVGDAVRDFFNPPSKQESSFCPRPDDDENKKNCQALKDSILNTCYGLPPRKKMACYEAANTAYRQCMGYE